MVAPKRPLNRFTRRAEPSFARVRLDRCRTDATTVSRLASRLGTRYPANRPRRVAACGRSERFLRVRVATPRRHRDGRS